MGNSNQLQRKQITKNIGHFEAVQVETGGNQGMQSNDSALIKRGREKDVEIETSNLLKRILARENMILAMKRVIKNKGSHGVDGKRCDELRINVVKYWDIIRRNTARRTTKPTIIEHRRQRVREKGTQILQIYR